MEIPKGYELKDLPDPKHSPRTDETYDQPRISPDAKAIVIALLAVASEIRQTRAMLEPASEINAMQLEKIKGAMGSGIISGAFVPVNR